jgi:hypothetical protein
MINYALTVFQGFIELFYLSNNIRISIFVIMTYLEVVFFRYTLTCLCSIDVDMKIIYQKYSLETETNYNYFYHDNQSFMSLFN